MTTSSSLSAEPRHHGRDLQFFSPEQQRRVMADVVTDWINNKLGRISLLASRISHPILRERIDTTDDDWFVLPALRATDEHDLRRSLEPGRSAASLHEPLSFTELALKCPDFHLPTILNRADALTVVLNQKLSAVRAALAQKNFSHATELIQLLGRDLTSIHYNRDTGELKASFLTKLESEARQEAT